MKNLFAHLPAPTWVSFMPDGTDDYLWVSFEPLDDNLYMATEAYWDQTETDEPDFIIILSDMTNGTLSEYCGWCLEAQYDMHISDGRVWWA
jgi:hypothetical protein